MQITIFHNIKQRCEFPPKKLHELTLIIADIFSLAAEKNIGPTKIFLKLRLI